MSEYITPGIYAKEFETGEELVEGVETSIVGFIGMTNRGHTIGKPRLISGFAEFRKYFGDDLGEEYSEHRFLSYAVDQFFTNGGNHCYIMRVAPDEQMNASVDIKGILKITAMSSGTWGNDIEVQIRKSYQAKTYVTHQATEDEKKKNQYSVNSSTGFYPGDLVELNDKVYTIRNVYDNILEFNRPLEDNYFKDEIHPSDLQSIVFDIQIVHRDFKEVYEKCSLNLNSLSLINALEKSEFIHVKLLEVVDKEISIEDFCAELTTDFKSYHLTGGTTVIPSAGYEEMYIGKDGGPSLRTGIQAFLEVNDVSIMGVPGITSIAVQNALITHCEKTANRFAILDAPLDVTTVEELCKHREHFDTTYAALYHPWLEVFDPLLKKNNYTPPSGAVAGIYARVDYTRGVWKAPANEVVRNVVGLSVNYSENDQGRLNPNGVNLIRKLAGMGIRVWGARTCSNEKDWKYLNVRRLLIYIEESIKASISWTALESNDENLWQRASRTIHIFLTTLWRSGALAGSSEDEAFFINVGKSTMTEDDIFNGRFICEIGVALVKPAEFVMIRITEKTKEIRKEE